MKINYFLDLEKVSKLSELEKTTIYDWYSSMLNAFQDNQLIIAAGLYNTLVHNNFLIDIREKKINSILN